MLDQKDHKPLTEVVADAENKVKEILTQPVPEDLSIPEFSKKAKVPIYLVYKMISWGMIEAFYAIDNTLRISGKEVLKVQEFMKNPWQRTKLFAKALGPGFITGAADDDPTAIAAYTRTGAQFGYGMLWTAPYIFPFMAAVQEMCARIGEVTGRGISGVIKKYYAKPTIYFIVLILLFANVVNIGADLGAMAASGQLLVGIPFIYWLLAITVVTLILEIFVSYKSYAKYLKYLTLALFAYVITAFLVKQDWGAAFRATIIPPISLKTDYLLGMLAILGTNISPYLFFWQASEEVEEEVEEGKIAAMGQGKPKVTASDLRKIRSDTVIGMLFSQLIVFFIGITAASTLGRAGILNVNTPAEAANALRPLAGNFAFILFSIGIIGSGLLTVPVLAGSASYAFSEAFGWKEGLYRKFSQAHGFYGVITVATLVGLLINFTSINPFKMLIYAAAINGVLAPILLVMILLIANNSKIMGKRTNSIWSNIGGIFITVAMAAAAVALFVTFSRT